MKVQVDFGLCEGQAVCTGIAPSVFELREDGLLTVLQAQPPEELRDAVEDAAAACPLSAILVRE
jgi:ferredoxin